MTDEYRIRKLESDVWQLQSDMTDIKRKAKSLPDILDVWLLVTGVAMIMSVWVAALALARFLRP